MVAIGRHRLAAALIVAIILIAGCGRSAPRIVTPSRSAAASQKPRSTSIPAATSTLPPTATTAGGEGEGAETQPVRGSSPTAPRPQLRIALYGDSLSREAEDTFGYVAAGSGAVVDDFTMGGTAICDFLPTMTSEASAFRPQVVLVQFSGNSRTACMTGYPVGTPEYFAKYRSDAEAAIAIFEGVGAHVYLVGAPPTSTAAGRRNLTRINAIYVSLASADPRVNYVDAGKAVTLDGAFAWTLPCLSFEPCRTDGTNIVRAPDGVHFCPTGYGSGGADGACSVYSSGATRYAFALLGAVTELPRS